jgi:hypothetical protein
LIEGTVEGTIFYETDDDKLNLGALGVALRFYAEMMAASVHKPISPKGPLRYDIEFSIFTTINVPELVDPFPYERAELFYSRLSLYPL